MTKTTRKSDVPGQAGAFSGERIVVIAGSGALPVAVAARLAEQGRPHAVLLIEGEAAPSDFEGHECASITLEQVGFLEDMLRRLRASRVVLAGGVGRRPSLMRLRWNISLLRIARRMLPVLGKGDDALLRAIVEHLESRGFPVVGAHEVVPDILAPSGTLTRKRPGKSNLRDIEAAFAGARAIGALDIGQAAIAVGGRCVALEGIEGTDGLLERMAGMRDHGRLAGRKGGVLAKCAKPRQETRADLPAIGPDTVDAALAAGLDGVAVEAGRTFLLDHGRLVERADALGLFVVGVDLEPRP